MPLKRPARDYSGGDASVTVTVGKLLQLSLPRCKLEVPPDSAAARAKRSPADHRLATADQRALSHLSIAENG